MLIKITDKNFVWFRYVDDVLCLWPVNLCLNEFMDKLNHLVETIKLAFENEDIKKLFF